MSSLIPDSDKLKIAQVFNDIHDTFAREITVFQRQTEVLVATNGTYNALYSRIKNNSTTRDVVTQTKIKARIQYQQEQKEMDLPGTSSQVNVQIGEGAVRVKLDKAGYDIFTKATKIEIDGEVFRIVSDASKIGPFAVDFYTLYLRRA